MKKVFVVALFLIAFSSLGFSKGFLWYTILKESPKVKLTGEVIKIPQWGDFNNRAMTIKTKGSTVKIFGIGPAKFWFNKGISTPKTGEQVSVEAFKVNINSKNYLIAEKITNCSGETITLRDSETAAPLWRNFKYFSRHARKFNRMHKIYNR